MDSSYIKYSPITTNGWGVFLYATWGRVNKGPDDRLVAQRQAYPDPVSDNIKDVLALLYAGTSG
jgi:hypothetical protein